MNYNESMRQCSNKHVLDNLEMNIPPEFPAHATRKVQPKALRLQAFLLPQVWQGRLLTHSFVAGTIIGYHRITW